MAGVSSSEMGSSDGGMGYGSLEKQRHREQPDFCVGVGPFSSTSHLWELQREGEGRGRARLWRLAVGAIDPADLGNDC